MCISTAQVTGLSRSWCAPFFHLILSKKKVLVSVCISTAQARTKSAPRGSQGLGLGHVHCKASSGMSMCVLVKTFYAFSGRPFYEDLARVSLSSLRGP